MNTHTFSVDYTYCPKGHADWIYIKSSTLYSDIFWCEKCDCFYEPSVRKILRGIINKNYSSNREEDLIKRAKFIAWKETLSYKDMEQYGKSKI